MPKLLPDRERCQYATAGGKRCRLHRLQGEGETLCFYHFNRSQKMVIEPHPGYIADQILSPDESLDSAQAVNAVLTRVFRFVAEGRLSRRDATVMAYVGQVILSGLPQKQREAAAEPAHPLLGEDPEAIVAELAQTLRRSIKARPEEAAPPTNTAVASVARESSTPAEWED